MSELLKKQDEGGYATLIAIIVIVVMGILLAGLLPFGTTVTQSAGYTRNALQAQYIAEAGVKRAIVGLRAGIFNSSLTGSNLIGSSGAYTVTVTPPTSTLTSGSSTVAGVYRVLSEGSYHNLSKKVKVNVTVTTADFTKINSADFVIGGNVGTAKTSVTIQSNGDMKVNGTVNRKAIGFTGDMQKTGHVTEDAKISITPVSSYFDALRNKATKEFWAQYQNDGQKLDLSDGSKIYYKDSPGLTIKGSDNIANLQGANGSDSYSIVVVDGDLTFDSSITSLNQNGNVVFIVKGNLYVNSNAVSLANCCFFCNTAYIGNASAPGNANFTGKLVAENDFQLNASLGNSNPASFDKLDEYLGSLAGGAGVTVSGWAKEI